MATVPEAVDDELEWIISDESIAKVGQTGVVTAVKEGEVIITVRSKITGLEDTATVVVKKKKEETPPGEEPPKEEPPEETPGGEPSEGTQNEGTVEGDKTDCNPKDEDRGEESIVPDTGDNNYINYYIAVLIVMGYVIVNNLKKYFAMDK